MSLATMRWTTIVMVLFVSLSGCSYFKGAAADDDADLTDLDDIEKSQPLENPKLEMAQETPPQEGFLELKLKIGDRFPLSKTVEHRLTQTDNSGTYVNTSLTDMMLWLVVEDVQPDGRKRMAVHYHKVQYQQDIRGQKIAYSSDRPNEPVPPEALLYSGLASNGFSFWLGPNNKVVEIVGFNDFLRRCLRGVPSQHVASVQQQLEGMKTEDGIANFIDDGIGLLPYSNDPAHPAVAVKEGSRWELEPRHSEVPVPMYQTTECMLKELSSSHADILLTGRISGPPKPVIVRGGGGEMKVLVKGGNTTGHCRVDRKTGLPTQSQVHRYLELVMELPDGQAVRQNKETVSTMRSFLNQADQMNPPSDRRVDQTSIRNAVGTENHRRVEQAGGPQAN